MVKFENEQATIAYNDFISYVKFENLSFIEQKPLCIGFIEALNKLGFLTQSEYQSMAMLWCAT